MPTPFTHLHTNNRIRNDVHLSATSHDLLAQELAAFLLGSIVVDAKPTPDAPRYVTHFYEYTRPMPDHPWREMFRQHPSLLQPKSRAHRAFLAGYVAHLATDEYWSLHMLRPHFALSEWGGNIHNRFKILHYLLIHMDERDAAALPVNTAAILRQCEPHDWLPFMPDAVIIDWRDFMADQLDGDSLTLDIFGRRIGINTAEIRTNLDNPAFMQHNLWDNVAQDVLHQLEAEFYDFSWQQMEIYLHEFNG